MYIISEPFHLHVNYLSTRELTTRVLTRFIHIVDQNAGTPFTQIELTKDCETMKQTFSNLLAFNYHVLPVSRVVIKNSIDACCPSKPYEHDVSTQTNGAPVDRIEFTSCCPIECALRTLMYPITAHSSIDTSFPTLSASTGTAVCLSLSESSRRPSFTLSPPSAAFSLRFY